MDDVPHLENSLYFLYRNADNRAITLNLETCDGKVTFKKLVKTADVVVDPAPLGYMASLGLDNPVLRQINPGLIMASVTKFGQTGPYRDWKGSNIVDFALSGVMITSGFPGKAPCLLPGTPAYDAASLITAISIPAALYYRGITGQGLFIDTAQTEVVAALVGEAYMDYAMDKRIQKPVGNRSPYAAPHGCYRCQGDDRWCAISVFTNEEWHNFCHAIGNPPWTNGPKFAGTLSQVKNVDGLGRLVEEWTVSHDAWEVMETLQAAGVAAGVVQRAPDTIEDPQLRSRGAILEPVHLVVGKRLYPGIPFRLSEAPALQSTPVPLLDQHTDVIRREPLKISQNEMKRLKGGGRPRRFVPLRPGRPKTIGSGPKGGVRFPGSKNERSWQLFPPAKLINVKDGIRH